MTEHLPSPSMWPFTIGAAVTLLAFGVVTSLLLSALGLVLLAFGLVGWIRELRHG
jgi:Cytochrome c oxidase subunit IV